MGTTYWWWERILLVVWMMVTLVLIQSYSGNLMALLAVRYIPQPYQTLQDVVEDSHVSLIWQKGSTSASYLKSSESGVLKEVANMEEVGRLIFMAHREFEEAINTLVRRGDHVLVLVDVGLKVFLADGLTKTGKCTLYESREKFLQIMLSMMGPKGSPIVPAFDKRITSMREAGLFSQWIKEDEPNSTVCNKSGNKITVNEPLAFKNVWGMFVILLVGHLISLSVFCFEILHH
ncbi:ionotropic receptor 93a-like [Cherax quadricarinatus]|uniref:ionotropic receptor 93a-like n=1 Tax=Cherax quadricarinatus TaxID=27406 RepID=UPI00387E63C4